MNFGKAYKVCRKVCDHKAKCTLVHKYWRTGGVFNRKLVVSLFSTSLAIAAGTTTTTAAALITERKTFFHFHNCGQSTDLGGMLACRRIADGIPNVRGDVHT